MATKYIHHWLEKTNESNVGLAGGLFANVKINQRVHEIPGVESVFVHPAMSDEGLAVGASLALSYTKTPDPSAISTPMFRPCLFGARVFGFGDTKIAGRRGR